MLIEAGGVVTKAASLHSQSSSDVETNLEQAFSSCSISDYLHLQEAALLLQTVLIQRKFSEAAGGGAGRGSSASDVVMWGRSGSPQAASG